VVGQKDDLKREILEWMHSSPTGGHSGRRATLKRIKAILYWKGMTKDVIKFIQQCQICQTCKYETMASPELLQPLPIPGHVWQHISMYFIEGLPNSFGKQVIFVVVDRLSKSTHFMPLSHLYSASDVAKVFFDFVFKLHGFPISIISDRDLVFVSHFWQELMSLQGVQLWLSSAYHPQTDGQTKVVNRVLETYPRCMCNDAPTFWSKWLTFAE